MRLWILICILCWSGNAWAVNTQWGVDIYQRFHYEDNFFDPDSKAFDSDDTYHSVYVIPWLDVFAGDHVSGRISTKFQWDHSFSDQTNVTDVQLDNLWCGISSGSVNLKLGLQRFEVARGYILDNEEPGVAVNLDITQDTFMNISAALIEDTSPLIQFSMGYRPGFFEKLEFFIVGFRDNDNLVANALNEEANGAMMVVPDTGMDNSGHEQGPMDPNQVHQNQGPMNSTPMASLSPQTPAMTLLSSRFSGQGNLYFFGLNMDLFLGDAILTAIMIYQNGNMDMTRENLFMNGGRQIQDLDLDISSFLADVAFGYSFTEKFAIESFVYYETGDMDTEGGDMERFISVVPYMPRASIFFNGGMEPYTETQAASVRKYSQAGVIGPGITFDWQPIDGLFVQFTTMGFLSERRISGTRRWYGWEFDLVGSMKLNKTIELMMEMDYFYQGNLYETLTGNKPDDIANVILGLNFQF